MVAVVVAAVVPNATIDGLRPAKCRRTEGDGGRPKPTTTRLAFDDDNANKGEIFATMTNTGSRASTIIVYWLVDKAK